jgi:hypothetical protein
VRPERITFSGHALQRMFERSISRSEIRGVVVNGEVIAEYPDDKPLQSCLMLGILRGRPIHVVLAKEGEGAHVIVVTAYEPDPALWEEGFRRRRSS